MSNNLPSQRCFGPYEALPSKTKWNAPSYVRKCKNPAHGGHFVDTRSGMVLRCDGTLVAGVVPGPSSLCGCREHGHIVNKNSLEVVG
jgi:hypothetical protein